MWTREIKLINEYTKICPGCGRTLTFKCKQTLVRSIKLNQKCRKCFRKSQKYLKNISNSMTGNSCGKGNLGIKRSEQACKDTSIGVLEYMKLYRKHLRCNVSKTEETWKDKIEKENNVILIQQYHVPGLRRYVDLYDKKNNIVYEVYGKKHKFPGSVIKDLKRQKEIENALNCKFVIIWDIDEKTIKQNNECNANSQFTECKNEK